MTYKKHIGLPDWHNLLGTGEWYHIRHQDFKYSNAIVEKKNLSIEGNGVVTALNAYMLSDINKAEYVRELKFHLHKAVITLRGEPQGLEKIVLEDDPNLTHGNGD